MNNNINMSTRTRTQVQKDPVTNLSTAKQDAISKIEKAIDARMAATKDDKQKQQIINTVKVAIKIIQENINHNGTVYFNNTKHYGDINEEFLKELFSTNSDTEQTSVGLKNLLEIVCQHRTSPFGDRKLSFWGTNYTGSAIKLRNKLDNMLRIAKQDKKSQPQSFNSKVVVTSQKPTVSQSLINASTSLVKIAIPTNEDIKKSFSEVKTINDDQIKRDIKGQRYNNFLINYNDSEYSLAHPAKLYKNIDKEKVDIQVYLDNLIKSNVDLSDLLDKNVSKKQQLQELLTIAICQNIDNRMADSITVANVEGCMIKPDNTAPSNQILIDIDKSSILYIKPLVGVRTMDANNNPIDFDPINLPKIGTLNMTVKVAPAAETKSNDTVLVQNIYNGKAILYNGMNFVPVNKNAAASTLQ